MMTTMQKTTEVCALCGTVNYRSVLTSYNNFGGQDTEFRPFAIGFDPLALLVHSCWQCGYTGYRISEGVNESIRPSLDLLMNDLKHGKICGGENMYMRMALIAEIRGEGDEAIGELWLRAAWMADDASVPNEAKLFRTNAAGRLTDALNYEEKTEKTPDFALKMVRLSEIYRRIGNFEQAALLLNKAENEQLPSRIRQDAAMLHQLSVQKETRQMMWSKNS